MSPASFTAACVQITAGREIEPNVARGVELVREAAGQGADFITLPENATLIEPDTALALAKGLPENEHPALPAFRDLAKETGTWILLGSLSIRDRGAEKLSNRSFLIDAAGNIAARYNKIFLFDVNLREDEWYRESDRIRPGSEAVVAPSPWGLIGLTICYDLRFPQLYRALAHAGAGILTIPSAFTVTTGRAHWHVLMRARAIETGAFVIAAAQCGEHAEGRKTYGHSLIVDPWGEILAEAGEDEGVILAEIDMAKVAQARKRIPSLDHDRDFDGPAPAIVDGLVADGG
ncbi:MAG: carbon-nitrogen hydrolase family protein [Alphaproteobacteria bacterium]|nr:carbon-nitrogen hydrolase family protein [Alphaproteobacteria bacterium]